VRPVARGRSAGAGSCRPEDGRIQLTPEGRRDHGAVQQQVEQIRRRVTERIIDADYTATVKTLGQMAANLESRDP
jgi:hypothetical protein